MEAVMEGARGSEMLSTEPLPQRNALLEKIGACRRAWVSAPGFRVGDLGT